MKLNYVLIATAICLLSVLGTISSCKKKPQDDPSADYDRAPFLKNIGNNIIIPNYTAFVNAVNSLDSGVAVFKAAPNTATLGNLQILHKNAYESWQNCEAFEFGPATTDVGLSGTMRGITNTFPTSESMINSNITTMASGTSTINFDAPVNQQTQGFPALDYLLFGVATNNTDIVTWYTDSNGTDRLNYLAFLSARIKQTANAVLTGWLPNGGNYISTFISSTGTDASSSTYYLLNAFVDNYDRLKQYKFNVPWANALPAKVEAYYSGISSHLMQVQLLASQNLYLGKSSAGDGIGFDDYLIGINAVNTATGAPLDPAIKAQYISAINNLAVVPDPFSVAITTYPASSTSILSTAYNELQKQIPLIKTQMPAQMDVLIASDDQDGD